jgi:hypothetical protein
MYKLPVGQCYDRCFDHFSAKILTILAKSLAISVKHLVNLANVMIVYICTYALCQCTKMNTIFSRTRQRMRRGENSSCELQQIFIFKLIKALPDMALKSVSLSPGKSGPRAG